MKQYVPYCITGMDLPDFCSGSAGPISLEMSRANQMLSSEALKASCILNNKQWSLKTRNGRIMNISLINLQHSNINSNSIYGSLKDRGSNKRVVFGYGPRYQQLLVSTASEVQITIQNTHAHFILGITGE